MEIYRLNIFDFCTDHSPNNTVQLFFTPWLMLDGLVGWLIGLTAYQPLLGYLMPNDI